MPLFQTLNLFKDATLSSNDCSTESTASRLKQPRYTESTGGLVKQQEYKEFTYKGPEPHKVYDLGKLLDIVDIGEQINRIEKRLINIEKMLRKKN